MYYLRGSLYMGRYIITGLGARPGLRRGLDSIPALQAVSVISIMTHLYYIYLYAPDVYIYCKTSLTNHLPQIDHFPITVALFGSQ